MTAAEQSASEAFNLARESLGRRAEDSAFPVEPLIRKRSMPGYASAKCSLAIIWVASCVATLNGRLI